MLEKLCANFLNKLVENTFNTAYRILYSKSYKKKGYRRRWSVFVSHKNVKKYLKVQKVFP